MKTTGAAAKLTLKADRARIKADGQDLSFVTVMVSDRQVSSFPVRRTGFDSSISGPAISSRLTMATQRITNRFSRRSATHSTVCVS